MANTVLIVVDIQRDYFFGGALPLDAPETAAENAKQALDYARTAAIPVIVVQHVALSPTATFFRPNTPGVELHPYFKPESDDELLVKHFPNAFRSTDLKSRLDALEARELVLAGMMTHMCIDSTVRHAADLEYPVTLLGDATATRMLSFNGRISPAPAVQTAALAALHGTFAQVTTTAEWTHGRGE